MNKGNSHSTAEFCIVVHHAVKTRAFNKSANIGAQRHVLGKTNYWYLTPKRTKQQFQHGRFNQGMVDQEISSQHERFYNFRSTGNSGRINFSMSKGDYKDT